MARFKYVFDESGGVNRGDYYSLAGVEASLQQWRAFRPRWMTALREGRPIAYFKMREAASQTGEFARSKGWTRPEIKRKVQALTEVVRDSCSGHVVVVIPMIPFRRVMRGTPLPIEYEDPYLACFFYSLVAVAAQMNRKQGRRGPPVLVYDTQTKFHQNFCRGMVAQIRRDRDVPTQPVYPLRRWLSVPQFKEDKAEDIGIQAADLLAWHYRTLPWERTFKPNRSRGFLNRIKGLTLQAYVPDVSNMATWRSSLQSYMKYRGGRQFPGWIPNPWPFFDSTEES